MGITLEYSFITITARTFLTGLTEPMLSDEKFLEPSTTLTLELWFRSSLQKVFSTSTNSNYVWTSDALISFDKIVLYSTTQHFQDQTIKFCIADLFALKENYINPYFYETIILSGTSPQQWYYPWPSLTTTYKPTGPAFTLGSKCTVY